MASKQVQQDIGQNRRTAGTITGQLEDVSESRELLPEKVLASSLIQSLNGKLEPLMSEVKDLTFKLSNISKSVRKTEKLTLSVKNSHNTCNNRFRNLESSVFRLQKDSAMQKAEERISALEDSLGTLLERALPNITQSITDFGSTLNLFLDGSLPSAKVHIGKLEFMQKSVLAQAVEPAEEASHKFYLTQAKKAVETRLSVFQASQNEFRDNALVEIEKRLTLIEESNKINQAEINNFNMTLNALKNDCIPSIRTYIDTLKASQASNLTQTVGIVESKIKASETSQNEIREKFFASVQDRLFSVNSVHNNFQSQNFMVIDSRLRALEASQNEFGQKVLVDMNSFSAFKNSVTKNIVSLETRLKHLETSQKECHEKILIYIDNRFSRFKTSEAVNDATVESRFKTLETSHEELRDKLLKDIDNRFSAMKNSQTVNPASVESRFKSLETSQKELSDKLLKDIDHRFNAMENSQTVNPASVETRLKTLETSQKELRERNMKDFDNRLSAINNSQKMNSASVKTRLKALVTSQNELHENLIKDIDSRFCAITNSQKKDSASVETRLKTLETLKEELRETILTDNNNSLSVINDSLDILQTSNSTAIEKGLKSLEISQNEFRQNVQVDIENFVSLMNVSLNNFQKLKNQAIETRLETSQNALTNNVRLNYSEMTDHNNQSREVADSRLKVLETFMKKTHDQDRPKTETRLDALEKHQSAEKLEIVQLAKVLDILCNDNISEEDAETVLNIASFFGMKNTINKWNSFLRNTLTFANCISIFQLASKFNFMKRKNAAWKMISENFLTVSVNAKDFWKLTLEELRSFVFSNKLCATEEHVFNAICKWVEQDRFTRTFLASDLLSAVQFSKCSLRFLEDISNHILLKTNAITQLSAEYAVQELTAEQKDTLQSSIATWRAPGVLWAWGGCPLVETLDKPNSSWVKLKTIPNGPRGETLAVTAGHEIIVVQVMNKKIRSFDILTSKWNDLTALPVFRLGMSAAVDGNRMYLIGGKGHWTRCDVYDFQIGSWTLACNLNVGRSYSGSATFEGRIYCCGGSSSSRALFSAEVHDPRKKEKTNSWSSVAAMSVARSDHCLVSCTRFLWAVGGRNGADTVNGLEKYDPRTDVWAKMASMPTKRSKLSASFYCGCLYAVGGIQTGKIYLNTVEIYDPENDTWTSGAPLNKGRCYHATCVVPDIS